MHTDDLSHAQWRKSSFSGNTGNCVEVAVTKSGVAVRDSKNPHGRVLIVSREEWRRFIHIARASE